MCGNVVNVMKYGAPTNISLQATNLKPPSQQLCLCAKPFSARYTYRLKTPPEQLRLCVFARNPLPEMFYPREYRKMGFYSVDLKYGSGICSIPSFFRNLKV